MAHFGEVTGLLDQLICRLVPGAVEDTNLRQDLLRYVSRIASSRFSTADQEQLEPNRRSDELCTLVRRFIPLDTETRERCDELLFKLLRKSNLLRREAVVRMLCDLSGSSVPDELSVLPLNERRRENYDHLQSFVSINKNQWVEEKRQQQPGVPNKENKKSRETEALLVRDVLYAFQGIDGHLIKFSSQLDKYHVAELKTIPLAMKKQVQELCEVGWLYSRVSQFVQANMSEESLGVVCQSFAYALQAELNEYFRLIAVLESQLEAEVGDVLLDISKPLSLTLRQLSVWSQEPRRRLQLMAEICDAVKGLRGGALASVVHIFSYNGDPFVSSFVESLMQKVSAPIFESIRLWVCHGELSDHSGEFFVSANESVPDERLWFDKYHLRSAMVPGFLGVPLAQKILLIGKSINFLRFCCNEDPEDDSTGEIEAEFAKLQVMSKTAVKTNTRTVQLLSTIDQAADATNKRLRAILFQKFKLLDHCRSLKQYLMLGQGDTIQYLMDLLSPHLSLPATQLYRHTLLSQLETAVRSSSMQNADAVLSRLDVRLLESSPGDSGWDVFVLDYHLDTPLSCVITSDSMSQYFEIFTFLWRLKRVEYSLSCAWKQEMTTEHVVREMDGTIRATLHKFHVLRNEMIHFTSNLHSYIMFEVLETSWDKLVSDLDAAVDLDQVVQAHQSYLSKVIDKSLIGPRVESEMGVGGANSTSEQSSHNTLSLRQRMQDLFDLILRFCNVQKRLYTSVLEQVNKLQRRRFQIVQRTENNQWGVDDDMSSVDNDQEEQSSLAKEYNRQIHIIAKEYRAAFCIFLECLQPTTSENLKFLRFRLDFNLFYDEEQKKHEQTH